MGTVCERTDDEIPRLPHRFLRAARQTRRSSVDRARSPKGRGVLDLFVGPR